MSNNFYTDIDLQQNQLKQAVFHKCTSLTRPANPVDGQLIYETDTQNIMKYNTTKSKWETVGLSGARVIKGTVGGSSQGALPNLPTTDVDVGFEYIVGADGDYGPSGSTQHATKGDSFVALTASDGVNPIQWLLIDNNNRVSGTFTVADGTTSYNIENTSGSTDLIVQVRDANGVIVNFDVAISQANITISMSSNSATAQDGNTFSVMASNG